MGKLKERFEAFLRNKNIGIMLLVCAALLIIFGGVLAS